MVNETKRLAEFVSETEFADIPSGVREHAKTMIIDTVGVMLVGADTETLEIASEKFGDEHESNSPAHVLGTSQRHPPEHAAFLNGISAHALDFDDVHQTMGGHPSAPILPPLLAVGEVIDASGADLLRSFVIGVETELVLAAILNPSHYVRGWHPTAAFGHLGAAAAVSSLRDLETEETRRALGIATSQTSGVKGNFGTMTKPFHVGKAARSGIEAANLAGAGFTANTNILELDFGGYCELFQGEDGYAFDDHIDELGTLWRLKNPPTNFKSHPCCGSTHVPIDLALEMRDKYDLALEDIDSVRITEHPNRLDHTDNPQPSTGLEAKFSVQYVVAKALQQGELWLDDFQPDEVTDPKITDFLKRVEVQRDESLSADRDRYGRLDLTAGDGTYSEETENRRQRSRADVSEKFRRCVGSSSFKGNGESILETLEALESISHVETITTELVT